MTERRLAAFALPLATARWALLRFDGAHWFLVGREAPGAEQPIARVDVVLELPAWRYLRLRWPAAGWRRWWPHECHLGLARRDHAAIWPLLGAALTQDQGRPWLGA